MGIVDGVLISIVIPVYNVEEYISRCLESILNQTFQNLEIILVDDGSTDNSGQLCDSYAELDLRITVIHTENCGVASARNRGLDVIHGQYFSFVDADDYISTNHIQVLYELLNDDDVDISVCGHNLVYNNGKILREPNQKFLSNQYIRYMNRDEALINILYKKRLISGVWGKLFKTDLLKSTRFPQCKFNEDLPFLFELLMKSSGWVYANIPTYNYYQRNTSLTHSLNIDTIPDTIRICEEIKSKSVEVSPNCENAARANLLQYCFYCYFAYPKYDYDFLISKIHLKQIIQSDRRKVIFDKNASIKIRVACLLSFFGLGLTSKVYSFFVFLSNHLDIFKHSK